MPTFLGIFFPNRVQILQNTGLFEEKGIQGYNSELAGSGTSLDRQDYFLGYREGRDYNLSSCQ